MKLLRDLAAPLFFLAALVWLTALALPSAASLVNETEPNDDPLTATAINAGDTGTGATNASDMTDYWTVNATSAGLFEVAVVANNCGYLRLAWGDNTTAPVVWTSGYYRLILTNPATLLVQVCGQGLTGNYSFTVTLNTDFTPIRGFDEVELNNDAVNATPIPADRYAEGRTNYLWGDIDFWRYDAPGTGWVEVNISRVPWGTARPHFFQAQGATAEIPSVRFQFSVSYYFGVDVGQPLVMQVGTETDEGGYSLRVRFRATLSELAPRADDVEPNDNLSTAQRLVAGVDLSARLDGFLDPIDVFVLDGRRGDFITVTIPAPSGGIDEINTLQGSLRFPPARNSTWFQTFQPTASVFLQSDETMVFEVRKFTGSTEMRIHVTVRATGAFDDGVLTLTEVLAAMEGAPAPASYVVRPNYTSFDFEYGGVDLRNGDGALFGQSLCFLVSGISNTLPGVLLEAGRTYERLEPPLETKGEGVVTTRNSTVDIPAYLGEGPAPWWCVYAVGYGNLQPYVRNPLRFVEAAPLAGDLAAVLRVISSRGAENASGQLAMWAVQKWVTEARAVGLGATNETLGGARDLLRAAGVGACLTGLVDFRCLYPDAHGGDGSPVCDPIQVTRPRERPSNTTNGSANQSAAPGQPPAAPRDPDLTWFLPGAALGALGGVASAAAALSRKQPYPRPTRHRPARSALWRRSASAAPDGTTTTGKGSSTRRPSGRSSRST